MALDDTQWHLHKAVKYVKLKQLLAAELGDIAACKRTLLDSSWNVDKAAALLLSEVPRYTMLTDQASPDCVDV